MYDSDGAFCCFLNFYACPTCTGHWDSQWSSMCDDDCPYCGQRNVSPIHSEDVEEPDDDVQMYLDKGGRQSLPYWVVVAYAVYCRKNVRLCLQNFSYYREVE